MDEHLSQLEHRVSAAADAWLTDPRDTQIYVRLVAAIEARHAYLNPQLPAPVEMDETGPPVGELHRDEVLDDLADQNGPPRAVGEDLAGDPVATLERLRHQAL